MNESMEQASVDTTACEEQGAGAPIAPIPTEEALNAARAEFPEFDADQALRDPAFLRLISPEVGLSPAEAYHLYTAERSAAVTPNAPRSMLPKS